MLLYIIVHYFEVLKCSFCTNYIIIIFILTRLSFMKGTLGALLYMSEPLEGMCINHSFMKIGQE